MVYELVSGLGQQLRMRPFRPVEGRNQGLRLLGAANGRELDRPSPPGGFVGGVIIVFDGEARLGQVACARLLSLIPSAHQGRQGEIEGRGCSSR